MLVILESVKKNLQIRNMLLKNAKVERWVIIFITNLTTIYETFFMYRIGFKCTILYVYGTDYFHKVIRMKIYSL